MKKTLRAQRSRLLTSPSDNGVLEQLQEYLRVKLLPRRHTALLVALVVLFFIRLIGDVGFAPVVFSCGLIALMIVSLYTVQVDELVGEREMLVAHKKKQSKIGWLLAIPAVGERFAVAITRNHYVVIIGLIFWLLFFGYIIWNELSIVLKQKEVTGETISLSISIYLLMGLIWSVLYVLLYYLQPHAFNLGDSSTSELSSSELFPVLVYFSLTTISTVGFGDITPLSLQARYAAVAEGITGQFYLAILVARLVGLYMTRTGSHDTGH